MAANKNSGPAQAGEARKGWSGSVRGAASNGRPYRDLGFGRTIPDPA